MRIEENLLVEKSSTAFELDIQRAANYGNHKPRKDSGKLKNPNTIVIHYTASNNKNSVIHTLYESSKQVSAHFVVDQKGTVTQLLPLNKIGWHAGRSRLGNRIGINKYSIGIEIVNPGFLTQKSDGNFATWYNQNIPKENAIQLKHKNEDKERFWHTYTEAQINSVFELCDAICDNFTIEHIVGHDDISPGRKLDPGPAFPLDKIQSNLLGNRKKEDEETPANNLLNTVNVENLNIRKKGSANSEKIALPLIKGQKVRILDEKDGWYKIETKLTGWVNGDYIK